MSSAGSEVGRGQELFGQFLGELRRLEPLSPERVRELSEELHGATEELRSQASRIPGIAILLTELWAERVAQGRVTGVLAQEDENETGRDWSAHVDEQLGVVSSLLERRRSISRVAPGETACIDSQLAEALGSAAIKLEILESLVVELLALAQERESTESASRRQALALGEPGSVAALERARNALERRHAARRTLAAHNLRLVVYLARRYRGQGVPLMDLIQEGSIGLLRAAEKFDPGLGFRFSTYAVWWIQQALTRAVQKHSRTVRLPSPVYEALPKYRETVRRLSATMPDPGRYDIAAALGRAEAAVELSESAFLATESLDPPEMEGEGRPLAERLADAGRSDPEQDVHRKRLGEALVSALRQLPVREGEVLRWRFGLGGAEQLTLQEIGARMGLSKERVRQIEVSGLARLARQPVMAGLRECVDGAGSDAPGVWRRSG